LSPGDRVGVTDVRRQDRPDGDTTSIGNEQDLVGRVLLRAKVENEPFALADLAPLGTQNTVALAIPEPYVGLSFPRMDLNIQRVVPGDQLLVLAVTRSTRSRNGPLSWTVASEAYVMSVVGQSDTLTVGEGGQPVQASLPLTICIFPSTLLVCIGVPGLKIAVLFQYAKVL
jgi:hypothetical protein